MEQACRWAGADLGLIEVDIPRKRLYGPLAPRLLEKTFEAFLQCLVVVTLSLYLFKKALVARPLLRFQPFHSLSKVFRNRFGSGSLVRQDRAGIGTHFELGSAAGAFDLEEVAAHSLILSHKDLGQR